MKLPLTWLFFHHSKLNGIFQFLFFSLFLITKCCSFSSVASFWVTSSNFIALNTSLYLDDSQIYMSSLVLPHLPLKQSHLISNRYVTLDMSKTELLIPILPNPLPYFSKWHHQLPSFSDQRSNSNPLFLSFLTSTSVNPIDCLHSDSFLSICTATTLTYLPPSLTLITIKYQLVQPLENCLYASAKSE